MAMFRCLHQKSSWIWKLPPPKLAQPAIFCSSVGHFGGSKVRFPLSELLTTATERDAQIRKDHLTLNSQFPKESHAPGVVEVDRDQIRRKRLIYRSKQRGWLEVDLLMGTWATENVPSLNTEEMDQYEEILNQETIDIFNFVSGKDEPPVELRTPMLHRLRQWAASNPLGAGPTAYANAKRNKLPN